MYNLGVIGGLGPLSTAYFYEVLTKKTKVKTDQDHLNLIILSHATTPDRTNYILDHTKKNPYQDLLNDCLLLEKLGCKLITIPCNTACYFHDLLQKQVKIKISNMVLNTVNYIKEKGYKSAVIMGTTGTIKAKLYQNLLEKENIKCLFPNQKNVMTIIYEYVKKGQDVPLNLFKETINGLNADCFILGCTELSILKTKFNLSDNFIDPIEVEVENILTFFNKERV